MDFMDPVIHTGILGGGWTGLLLGNELRERGVPFLVLEQEATPGGLARTVRFKDVAGDTGPHALYSHDPKVMRYLRSLPVRYGVHHRKVRVVHHGNDGQIYEVDYPFENGIGGLPLPHRIDCLEGYLAASANKRRSFRNLRDWIDHGLGSGIARHFMIPYNRKIWNAPLRQISMDLVKKKIDPAPLRAVIEAAFGKPSIGRKVQSVFLYPKGGIGKLTELLSQRIQRWVRTSESVLKVERIDGVYAVTTSKNTYRFRRLISAIPLKKFLKIQPFSQFRRYSSHFKHNDTIFVSVALKKGCHFRRFDDCHWLFFAGPEIFYRVNMMHVFYQSRRRHLVAEITHKGDLRQWPQRRIESRVLRDLRRAGILARMSDVESLVSKFVPYTYPIPTAGLHRVLKRLDAALARKGIFLVGRSGHWDYINMDQVVSKVWNFIERHPA